MLYNNAWCSILRLIAVAISSSLGGRLREAARLAPALDAYSWCVRQGLYDAATLLSEKLTGGGYVSHFVGKGHLGYETMDHLPVNRGFKSHVGYLEGSQSYYWGCGSAGGEHATAPCKRQRLSIR